MNKTLKTISISFLLLTLSSCSLIRPDRVPLPLRASLEITSSRYINSIINADYDYLSNRIIWAKYLRENGLSKNDFMKEVYKLQLLYTDRTNPLIEMLAVDTEADDNSATVSFKCTKCETFKDAKVFLNWVGSGWIVSGDTLFGPNGSVSKALAKGEKNI